MRAAFLFSFLRVIMATPSGSEPLKYRWIGRADVSVILRLDLDPGQVERFLGPLSDILTAVRRGPAHTLFGIEAEGEMVGFYVVHPDPRDGACWWLGWFALDRRVQGRGYGRAAMDAIVQRLHRIAGCRRIRLAVTPDNVHARRLYEQVGFRLAGLLRETGDLVMEWARAGLGSPRPEMWVSDGPMQQRAERYAQHRRLRPTAGPHGAWVIGVERGPPGAYSLAV